MLTRLLIGFVLFAAGVAHAEPTIVTSPDGKTGVTIDLRDGVPQYRVRYHGRDVIADSALGMTFRDGGALKSLELAEVRRDSLDEMYPVVAGKSATARDHYNEATIALRERDGAKRGVEIVFRAYDDGVAFRYRLPQGDNAKEIAIASEDSTFSLPPDAKAWVLPVPNFTSHYEYNYQPEKAVEFEPGKLIGLPLMFELPDNGPAAAITEANLTDYAGMYLTPATSGPVNVLRSALSPRVDDKDVAVKWATSTPHVTPWRVIMIAPNAAKLIESNLVSNLNDPCAIADTSWIKPGKTAFLWWNGYLVGRNGKRGGVDTKTFNNYVDAAAEFGFEYSSIDGLDIAWYGGKIPGYGENDVTVPVKELDIQAVLKHAKEKGVRIRLWVASQGLRKYLDKALATYEQWGVEGIMVDFIERDDQEAVTWVREVVEKAAKHKLTVTLHNVSKPTGLHRTYPNLLTREAVRNQEWNKWDPAGVSPEHNLIVPFTRMLAGPLDYHSGGFRSVRAEEYRPRDVAPEVMGTRCHQLAMYVVYENPMPMAVDYPAAYRGRPGLDFLSSVPTTWDETRVIDGVVGDHITIARRKGKDWYVGSMTDETARELKIPLTFLGDGTFTAEIWSDDPAMAPNGLKRGSTSVTASGTLGANMISAGGFVARLKPVNAR